MPEALVNLKVVIVVEAERIDEEVSPVICNAPLINEMVAEVERKLLAMASPNKVVCVVDDPTLTVNPGVEEPRSRVVEVIPKYVTARSLFWISKRRLEIGVDASKIEIPPIDEVSVISGSVEVLYAP